MSETKKMMPAFNRRTIRQLADTHENLVVRCCFLAADRDNLNELDHLKTDAESYNNLLVILNTRDDKRREKVIKYLRKQVREIEES